MNKEWRMKIKEWRMKIKERSSRIRSSYKNGVQKLGTIKRTKFEDLKSVNMKD